MQAVGLRRANPDLFLLFYGHGLSLPMQEERMVTVRKREGRRARTGAGGIQHLLTLTVATASRDPEVCEMSPAFRRLQIK